MIEDEKEVAWRSCHQGFTWRIQFGSDLIVGRFSFKSGEFFDWYGNRRRRFRILGFGSERTKSRQRNDDSAELFRNPWTDFNNGEYSPHQIGHQLDIRLLYNLVSIIFLVCTKRRNIYNPLFTNFFWMNQSITNDTDWLIHPAYIKKKREYRYQSSQPLS